ncbi:MAG TPA: DUF2235 domain-containing protein [Burkholderiales bacterium]|nr:DUF2235 domain-containing protein [Burkholderiales bacterium]
MTRWILCFDGTWNDDDGSQGDRETLTNVCRLYQSIPATPEQVKWYDKGVGTGFLDRLRGGLFGIGLDENIRQGYKWLAHRYRTGDRIYLFGFSRGAYTARSLGGFIRRAGLLRNELVDDHEQDPHEAAVTEAYEIYRSRDAACLYDGATAQAFRAANSREVDIELIGVWDTVGTLGIPGDWLGRLDDRRYLFHDTGLGPHVKRAAHAVAIDEHREDYAATLWSPEPRVAQVWFAGAHADVGGGYREHELADTALRWMQLECAAAGIDLAPAPAQPLTGREPLHDSFKLFMRGTYAAARKNERSYRTVDKGALHPSVTERMGKNPAYRPPNLV